MDRPGRQGELRDGHDDAQAGSWDATRRIRLLLALVALASPALAQTITRGPIIQNPDALTTTMTILWWTNVAGDSTVEYGTTPALGSSVTVAQAASCEIGAAGTCHAVPLTGLLPGTRYFYRLLTNGVEVQAPRGRLLHDAAWTRPIPTTSSSPWSATGVRRRAPRPTSRTSRTPTIRR